MTIATLPGDSGHGGANPTDYYGVGQIRPGNATAFWEPFVVIGGPQWMPVPSGTTQIGYALADGAVVSVAEVAGSSPLAFPLASLPDVALASVTDAQVLAYQASSSKWINATPTGGAGGGGASTAYYSTTLAATAATVRLPASGSLPGTGSALRISVQCRGDNAAAQTVGIQFSGVTTSSYYWQQNRVSGGIAPTGAQGLGTTSGLVSTLPGTGGLANAANAIEIWIPNYAGTTFIKHYLARAHRMDGTGGSQQFLDAIGGVLNSTAAITSVTLVLSAGNFIVGSAFSLYIL